MSPPEDFDLGSREEAKILKVTVVHVLEYSSAMKRNEVLIYAMTRTNLSNMPKKRSQTLIITHCRIPLVRNVPNSKIHSDTKQIAISGCWRGERDVATTNGYKVSFQGKRLFGNCREPVVAQHCDGTNCPELCALKWLASCCVIFLLQ